MRNAIQWLRSLLFIIQMYVMLPIVGFVGVPLVWIKRDNAFKVIHFYCNWVRWTASWMIGLKSEIRGEVPTGEVLIAAKHQSFFDILLLASVLPRLKFNYKSQLKWAPIINIYAVYTNSVPVNRGKRSVAIKKMVADVARGTAQPGQLIIYPQGTRIAPGVKAPYKVGSSVLYTELGQDCVPVATNVGVFWPRHGIYRKPGLAVVEFLPRIEAGLPKEQFMKQLEEVVETNSNRLMVEAGFDPDGMD